MQETILVTPAKHLNLYEGFTNAITGETFKCLSYNREAFTFEWRVQPNGYVPFAHIHLNQDEVFQIRNGEMRIIIERKEIIVRSGDSIRVPKGKTHIAFNNKPEVLDCVVSYKPGLDSFKFFQCFGGLTVDNDMDKRGQVNIPKMLYFTKRMNALCLARPSSIPAPLFDTAISVCYAAGKLLGWEKDYIRYTSHEPNHNRPVL